ncbi:MAG: hypothetical protein B7733_02280 [Myxococcales bacterium FL481]|nr:MAG: hypothetical protein B7733_02280 [Myxococcales bacterium FL481]
MQSPREVETESVVDAGDPYRAATYDLPRTFTARERSLLASTGRWMRLAGGLNLMLGALGLGQVFGRGFPAAGLGDLLLVIVPTMLAALTWSAGRSLGAVQTSERPYLALQACLAQVRTVFRVKGMIVISIMVMCVMMFMASFLAALLA